MSIKKRLMWFSMLSAIAVAVFIVLVFVFRAPPIDYGSKSAAARAEYAALLESVQGMGEDARVRLLQIIQGNYEMFGDTDFSTTDDMYLIGLLLSDPWGSALLLPAKRKLENTQETVDELITVLLECDSYVVPIEEAGSLTIMDQIPLREMSLMRKVQMLLLVELRSGFEQQDWDRIHDLSKAHVQLTQYPMMMPSIISLLISNSISASFASEIRILCKEHLFPPETALQFRNSLLVILGLYTCSQKEVFDGERLITKDLVFATRGMGPDDNFFSKLWPPIGNHDKKIDHGMELAFTYWNSPRIDRGDLHVGGISQAAQMVNMSLEVMPGLRDNFDMLVHQIVATIAVIDLEQIYAETGRYPESLPDGIIELIPQGIRFGEGIVYELVGEDAQDYKLLLPPETPKRLFDNFDGVYDLERDPLSEEDIALLERLTEEMVDPVPEPAAQD